MGRGYISSKVGNYRIPVVRLPTLLPHLIEIYRTFNSRDFSYEEFAQILKLKSTSSGIPTKIFEMKNFGLLTESNKRLRITDLGMRLFTSNIEERQANLLKVIRKIPFWAILLDKRGPNDDSIMEILLHDAKMDEIVAKVRLTEIRDAFLKDISSINSFDPKITQPPLFPQGQPTEIPVQDRQEAILTPIKEEMVESTMAPDQDKIKMSIDYGTHHMDIEDELTYRFAEQMMKAMRKELERRGVKFEF